MNRRGKASTFFLVVLLILFSFAMLGAGAFLWISYDKEKKHAAQLTTELSALRDEKDKIQKLLDDTNKEKVLLEKKIKEHEETLVKLNEKLTSETEAKLTLRKEREELLNKIVELNSENDNFKMQLEEKNKEVVQLEEDLKAMVARQENLKQSIAAGADNTSEGQPTSSTGEKLEPIVVSPATVSEEGEGTDVLAQTKETTLETPVSESVAEAGAATMAPTPLSANVLLVNREHNFVIIDAGQDNGVNAGDIFEIFHNDELIGKVEVEKVHDTLSAANFLSNFKAELATTSDVAKRTTK